MEVQLRTCDIYVDYEGLLVGLSYNHCLEIESVLIELLQKARQQYSVLHAVVLGTWLRQESRELLTELGYTCQAVSGSEREVTYVLQDCIVESLPPIVDETADVFLFIGGKANRIELLRQVCLAQKTCILWTLEPPALTERLLCSEWEQIRYPDSQESWIWPRQIMLHALVLVADALHGEAKAPFSHKLLCEQLNQLKPFNNNALYWLSIALRERILVPQADIQAKLTSVKLNRQHQVVRKAFFLKERILMTLSVMLTNRDWVAFSALEKALGMSAALTQDQKYRQAWLEVLVSTGALLTRTVPHPEGSYIVTTLSFNRDQQVLALLHEQEKRNMQRFIIATNDFIVRREQQSIKRASVARMLLKTMTSIEARSTFREAMEQEIVRSGQIMVSDQPNVASTRVWLNSTHPLVQMTLNQRDQFILRCYSLVLNGNGQVSESFLAEELTLKNQVGADETLFWIYLFIDEGILVRDRMGSGTMLSMKRQDMVIQRALDQLN